MRFLAGYRGALIVVSHDLNLLDASITRILHLDDAGLVEYKGTYSQYRRARKAHEERRAAIAARQQAEIVRLKSLADSMRHQTEKRARKARTLDTRVERLRRSAIDAPKRERRVGFRFPRPPHCGRPATAPAPADGLAHASPGRLAAAARRAGWSERSSPPP